MYARGTPGTPPLHYTVNALSAGKLARFVSYQYNSLQQFVCICLPFFFFLVCFLSLLSTRVLCAVVSHQKGFRSNVFLSRLRWGVSVSGYLCRLRPYLHSLSVDVLKAGSHVWRSRFANVPSEGMQITFARAPVSCWQPAHFF